MNKDTFLRSFQLTPIQTYHPESLLRLAHLKEQVLTPAAVLIALIERKHGLTVLFTRRSINLRQHSGQISFPGGKYEHTDKELCKTAVRETIEEIGVDAEKIHIIGNLPPLPTISQFEVTPFIAFLDADHQIKLDPNEVAEVFEVPLVHLLNPNNLHSQTFSLKHTQHRVFALPFQDYFIWGVTAQILQALQKHYLL